LVDLFYKQGKVIKIRYLQKGIRVKASIPKILYQKLLHSNDLSDSYEDI